MMNNITKKKNYNRKREAIMNNKMIKRTVVVFEHEMSLDEFPELLRMPEAELTKFLNDAVVGLFDLRKKEEELNKYGTHSFIRIKDVI